jgi:hypothetical protein
MHMLMMYNVIVGTFVSYNFQIGNNKIKLLTEYENVSQKVVLLIESILQNAKQLQHRAFRGTFPV